jgi:hypothetical protein
MLILVNRENAQVPPQPAEEFAKHRQVVAVLTDEMGETVIVMLKDNVGGTVVKDVTP